MTSTSRRQSPRQFLNGGDVRTAVFLDRDGTINAMVYRPELNMLDSPGNPDEFELLDGEGQAIRLINKMATWLSSFRINQALLKASSHQISLEQRQTECTSCSPRLALDSMPSTTVCIIPTTGRATTASYAIVASQNLAFS